MVNIGSTGSLGSEWSVQKGRQNALSGLYGQQLSYIETIKAQGADLDAELDDIGIELQFDANGSIDENLDLFNEIDSVANIDNKDDMMYQSNDGKFYTEVNFETGTYQISSEKQFAASMGIVYDNEDSKPYDYIKLRNIGVQFTDLVFAGSGDGVKDKISLTLSQVEDVKWGRQTTFNIEEAYDSDVNIIKDSLPQYIINQIENELSACEKGTDDYNKKFLEIATKLLDQEGYKSGKEVAAPGATQVSQSSKSFDVIRDSNGRVRIVLNSDKDVDVKGVGVVKGSGMISLGATTDGSNESVIQIGNNLDSSMNVSISNDVRNLDGYGKNVNANFNTASESYNVNWTVNNGSIDSSSIDSTMFLNAGGSNNKFNLNGNTYVIDENKANNTYNWKGNTINNK